MGQAGRGEVWTDVVSEDLHQRTVKGQRSMLICAQTRMEVEMGWDHDLDSLGASGSSRSPRLSAMALISFQGGYQDSLVNTRTNVLHQTGPRAKLSDKPQVLFFMIQVTDSMGKSNPHGLDRLFIVVVSRLNQPGVKELAGLSKSEALWKEFTELH